MKESRPVLSCRRRERLAEAAEEHLLVGDEAGQAHGVEGDPAYLAAARAGNGLDLGFDALEGLAAGLDHLLGSGLGGAAGGVDLAGVVELDDLGVVEEARGLAGEVHEQHGADGEVGRDHDAELSRAASSRSSSRKAAGRPVVPMTRRTPRSRAARARTGVQAAFEKSTTTSGWWASRAGPASR